MKHTSKFRYTSGLPSKCCVDMETTEKHHELSYYLNGGIDLNGDALSKDGDAEFDTEEEVEEIIAEGASSVALGDPRQSKFRLVEDLGSKAAKAATSKNPKTSTTTTDDGSSVE